MKNIELQRLLNFWQDKWKKCGCLRNYPCLLSCKDFEEEGLEVEDAYQAYKNQAIRELNSI